MNRAILATAAATVATLTLFASSAQACISCSYTPEVVHEGNKRSGHIYAKRHLGMSAVVSRRAARPAALARKPAPHQVKVANARPSQPTPVRAATADAKNTAKSTAKADGSEITQTTGASLALLKTDADASSAANAAPTPPVEAKATEATPTTETAPAAVAKSDKAPVTTASIDKPANNEIASKEDKPVGCKKFIPAAGITISIACK